MEGRQVWEEDWRGVEDTGGGNREEEWGDWNNKGGGLRSEGEVASEGSEDGGHRRKGRKKKHKRERYLILVPSSKKGIKVESLLI